MANKMIQMLNPNPAKIVHFGRMELLKLSLLWQVSWLYYGFTELNAYLRGLLLIDLDKFLPARRSSSGPC